MAFWKGPGHFGNISKQMDYGYFYCLLYEGRQKSVHLYEGGPKSVKKKNDLLGIHLYEGGPKSVTKVAEVCIYMKRV